VCVFSSLCGQLLTFFKMDHLKSDSHLVWVLRLNARGTCRRLGQFSPMREEPLTRAKGKAKRAQQIAAVSRVPPQTGHTETYSHLITNTNLWLLSVCLLENLEIYLRIVLSPPTGLCCESCSIGMCSLWFDAIQF